MMARNLARRGLSCRKSGERQYPLNRPQSAHVREEGVHDPLLPERNQTEMATSGPVPRDIGRLALFGGFFHPRLRVVASWRPHRTTTGVPLRVVPRVQPGVFGA